MEDDGNRPSGGKSPWLVADLGASDVVADRRGGGLKGPVVATPKREGGDGGGMDAGGVSGRM